MINKNINDAYSEVIEVLKYIPIEDYNKIPEKLINLLNENYNEKSNFVYNIALPMDEQNLSDEAKIILATIYKTCWADK